MKKIRILHVLDSLHLGGAQEVVLTLVRGADVTRYHHEVATLHGRGVYWERMAAAQIPLHSLSPSKYLPLYLPRLAALLRSGDFDILHCHLGASNIIAKPLGRSLGVPHIISHDHTNDLNRQNHRCLFLLDRWANQSADWFIAVSESCRRFLIEAEGLPSGKITLVPNAIDTAHYAPGFFERDEARRELGLGRDDLVVAGVGRLNPQKNFGLFLEILAGLHERFPRLRGILAGTGPEEAMLREQTQALGLNGLVQFAGYLPDTRKVYAATDVLLMPSRFEGLPMTLLEAMASAVPVVASALDGMAEVIHEGEDGFLCPPGETATFQPAVADLLQDATLRERIGQAARQTVMARYGAPRMIQQIEAIYQQLSSPSA